MLANATPDREKIRPRPDDLPPVMPANPGPTCRRSRR